MMPRGTFRCNYYGEHCAQRTHKVFSSGRHGCLSIARFSFQGAAPPRNEFYWENITMTCLFDLRDVNIRRALTSLQLPHAFALYICFQDWTNLVSV